MAKRLNDYDFVRKRGGPAPIYPWDQWTDGHVWRIKEGADFKCSSGSMVVYLYHQAKERNLRVRTSREPGKGGQPDHVVFQFWKDEPPAATKPKTYRRLKRK